MILDFEPPDDCFGGFLLSEKSKTRGGAHRTALFDFCFLEQDVLAGNGIVFLEF